MKRIKQTEAVAEFLGGGQLMVVEYRASTAETVNYRDKTTQRAASMESLRHTVETDKGAVSVDERVPDNQTAGAVLAAYRVGGLLKGAKVVLRYSSIVTQKGVTSARGTLELLEASAK